MSQETEKIKYCPAGHSSKDFYPVQRNYINFNYGRCDLCSCEHYIKEFKTWSSGSANIDRIIQESQTSDICSDNSCGSVYSAELKNGIKSNWNFIKQDWEYDLIGKKVALKEIKDSRYDIAEFFKVIKVVNDFDYDHITKYHGISKNPSTLNHIIVMSSLSNPVSPTDFHPLRRGWEQKIDILLSIADVLEILHVENLVYYDLRSGNILNPTKLYPIIYIDLDLCKKENNFILNVNNKNNQISGSILYILPEVLRGNEFTREGDIYSFDICNGVRPKVPDFMLNWIPEWYLDLMYRCWSDDPSECPTVIELADLFYEISNKLYNNIVDNNVI
ncbi:hypothetical protein Glove_84g148 [Diversispora epigaea]|uniref:Protein kinase domain-containing protein n=1 Tax=Diversispora epigaea TaxID=1348612 RepID=A0A397JHU6_9GLOM|nr:hypothetical protein Glove_84g148 [Diversispora epigaea]